VSQTGSKGPETAAADATLVRDAATELQTKPRRDAATRPAALAAGTLIAGDYRIVKIVGSDELAISYMAEDVNLSVAVLLKQFAPELGADGEDTAAARARFLREAQMLVRFRHPSIVRAHRVFEADGSTYIVLDYETGKPFDVWLTGLGRPPTQAELDRMTAPLLAAVANVHQAGYVHGDICPANVLMREVGGPLLIGFAGAWAAENAPAKIVTTEPAFAAPEVCRQDAGGCRPGSDIYAVAALLHAAITGEPPGPGERQATVTTPGDYRPEFLAAIERALSPAIADRPANVEAWAGIRPPEAPEPARTSLSASAQTLLREAPAPAGERTILRPSTDSAPTKVAAFSQLATRVISALPAIKEETDIPRYDFEVWLLPAAFVAGALGALLFATGANFALAAVGQVAATGLVFLRGYLPLSRFLSHTTRQSDAILRRAEQATRTAIWMIATILALMTVNPLFVERFITSNVGAPLSTLTIIIGIPALVMAACGFFGTPVRATLASYAVGTANILVLIFSVLLFAGFFYTVVITPVSGVIHPAVQVNRYLYILATLASGTLCVLVFVARVAARQRLKQTAMDN
jgi:serine/threonine protein kinase